MEPRKSEKPVESGSEGQTSQPRQPEPKRRFQIVKLEERLAPNKSGHTANGYCVTLHPGHCK
jgi:hypothetical protein